ncbi:hypothetical protein AC1031_001876 [Aphanomyces cochlioides]|nr:hypothetical protein AC1031_001876 [Aphanomyces cochlioides]
MAGPAIAEALYKYMPEEDDELAIEPGDAVYVLEYLDDGWCRGYLQSNPSEVGYFPANYVHAKKQPSVNSHLPPYKAPNRVARRGKAVYDYVPQEMDELELQAGDVVVILDTLDDGWCHGYLASDPTQKGMFPSNYVDIQADHWTTVANHDDSDDDPHWRRRISSTPPPISSRSRNPSRETSAGSAAVETPLGTLAPSDSAEALVVNHVPPELRQTNSMLAHKYTPPPQESIEDQYDDTTQLRATEESTPVLLDDETQYVASSQLYTDAEELINSRKHQTRDCGEGKVDESASSVQDMMANSSGINVKLSLRSVVQLKRELRRARENADRALAARLAAESQMQAELDARRRAEREAANRLQKQRENEASTVEIERAIQKQIQLQMGTQLPEEAPLDELEVPLTSSYVQVEPRAHAVRIQRWYRHQYSTRQRRQHVQQNAAATRIQKCRRKYVTKSKLQTAVASRRVERKPPPSLSHDVAATRIQKRGRIYIARRQRRRLVASKQPKQAPVPRIVTIANYAKAPVPKKQAAATSIQRTWRATRPSHSQHLPSKAKLTTQKPLRQQRAAPPPRPPRAYTPREEAKQLTSHPSVAILPVYATDVAQISQLAGLIANSVNIELTKRMQAHDAQLSQLTTSVLQLQHAIQTHNQTLERVYEREERRGKERLKEPSPSMSLARSYESLPPAIQPSLPAFRGRPSQTTEQTSLQRKQGPSGTQRPSRNDPPALNIAPTSVHDPPKYPDKQTNPMGAGTLSRPTDFETLKASTAKEIAAIVATFGAGYEDYSQAIEENNMDGRCISELREDNVKSVIDSLGIKDEAHIETISHFLTAFKQQQEASQATASVPPSMAARTPHRRTSIGHSLEKQESTRQAQADVHVALQAIESPRPPTEEQPTQDPPPSTTS